MLLPMCRRGDQSLFIKKELFDELGGYDDELKIMEDYDFIKRAKKEFLFKVIPKNILVSARKYQNNSYLKVNLANLIVFWMYTLGCSQ